MPLNYLRVGVRLFGFQLTELANLILGSLLLIEDITKRNVDLGKLPGLLDSVENKIHELLEDFNQDFG